MSLTLPALERCLQKDVFTSLVYSLPYYGKSCKYQNDFLVSPEKFSLETYLLLFEDSSSYSITKSSVDFMKYFKDEGNCVYYQLY